MIFLLNTANGFLIGDVVKRTASLETNPGLQVFLLDGRQIHFVQDGRFTIDDELHSLNNWPFMNCEYQNKPVRSFIKSLSDTEKPASAHQGAFIFANQPF